MGFRHMTAFVAVAFVAATACFARTDDEANGSTVERAANPTLLTRDGYTIVFEQFAARAYLVVGRTSVPAPLLLGGGQKFHLVGPVRRGDPAEAHAHLAGRLLPVRPAYEREIGYVETKVGLSDREAAAFVVPAELPSDTGTGVGPSVIVRARATKGDRSFLLAVTLLTRAQGLPRPVVVGSDGNAMLAVTLHPEAVFGVGESEPYALFGSFARADADGDGIITAAELDRTAATAEERETTATLDLDPSASLADVLVQRVSQRVLRY